MLPGALPGEVDRLWKWTAGRSRPSLPGLRPALRRRKLLSVTGGRHAGSQLAADSFGDHAAASERRGGYADGAAPEVPAVLRELPPGSRVPATQLGAGSLAAGVTFEALSIARGAEPSTNPGTIGAGACAGEAAARPRRWLPTPGKPKTPS